MKDKFKIIIIPYLLAHFLLLVVYTFLNWLFVIKLQLVNGEDRDVGVVLFMGPMVLAAIIAWVPIRRRVTILNLRAKKNGNWKDFFSVIAWFSLSAPAIFAQAYIETAAGKLTTLNTISEINTKPATKYYSLKDVFIDRYSLGIHTTSDVSGKHNQDFNMNVYVAMPIFDRASDTTAHNPPAWLGVKYHKTINNRYDDEKKNRLFHEFMQECQDSFNKTDVTKYVYLKRMNGNPEKESFEQAIDYEEYNQHNSHITIVGVNEPFSERNGNKMAYILISLAIGSICWIGMVLGREVDKWKLEEYKNTKTTKENDQSRKELREMLIPHGEYFITPIICYVNIIIYIIMAFSGAGFMNMDIDSLYKWGGNYPPDSFGSEPWRLLTNIFIHGNLMHLAGNIYGTIFTGWQLEGILGRRKMVILYILSGIFASVVSAWWHEYTPLVGVGASGAIFGLIGAIIAFSLDKQFRKELFRVFIFNTIIFAALNLLFGLMPGIDNSAHIGGLVSGFIIGLLMGQYIKRQRLNESI